MNYLYDVEIAHLRSAPVTHRVRQRSHQWFVDLDDLPRLPWPLRGLARFQASDHVGTGLSLRENIESFLDEHGIAAPTRRITMLTNARSFGYVFNPLTVFWCHNAAGVVIAVVAEVHNTYGDRHRYLLRPDENGRAEVAKDFYVSPFYPVDGYYRMRLPEPGERLALTITLHRPNQPPFTASVRGVRRPATLRAVLATNLRQPLESWRIRAAIQWHGVRLFVRRVPVVPRPIAPQHPVTGQPQPTDHHSKESTTMAQRSTVADRIASLLAATAGLQLPVRLRAWDGSEAGPASDSTLVLRSRRALRHVLWSPNELGLARAYITGDLDVEGDLLPAFRQAWTVARSSQTTRIDLATRDRLRAAAGAVRLGVLGRRPSIPASEARLEGRLHSRRRDRAAISHHYDLSNDFYQLLLDPAMAYSSAYFTEPGQSLESAQFAKLDLICRKLGLEAGMTLLDVGCGWGSLILHAAEHYGVRATGVTLSEQQRDFIAKRIADRGLDDLVTVRLQDYREIPADERYDAVSSIEMGEHVGQENYGIYAATLHDHLRPTGRVLLQQMSRRGDAAPGGGAFIESYIAPDMHMRPLSETLGFLENAGLEIRDVEALREHYVRTVEAWIQTFESHYSELVAMVGEEIVRVWRLYLVGGALTFEEGRMGVDQVLAVRPTVDGISEMAPDRPWTR